MTEQQYTLAELADMVGGEVGGSAETVICGLADLASAAPGEITFLTKIANLDALEQSKASAAIVPLAIDGHAKPIIRVQNPYLAAAIIHAHFRKQEFVATGTSPRTHIGIDCQIPDSVNIGPMAVLGDRVELGERVTVGPGVVIGNNVILGDDCHLRANVTIYDHCRIGNRVSIHSGTVVGSDGFGYATDNSGNHVKWLHVGSVRIEDDVEIGANVTIDRGTFGLTLIRKGTKIDNLVQIGHNVEIGESTLLVAQVGIAGSTTLGKNVVIGGQVGIKGHIHLADRVMIAAKSGVHSNLKAGTIASGVPAIDHKDWLRASALFAKLPRLHKELRALQRQVADLAGDVASESRQTVQPSDNRPGDKE